LTGLSFEEVLRTAYIYALSVEKVVGQLAERGVSLADCTAADVAARRMVAVTSMIDYGHRLEGTA
jgi:hypothetical protein